MSDRWFVVRRARVDGFECFKLVEETAQMVRGNQPNWPRLCQFRKAEVLTWFDNAESAEALVQRLESSVALMNQERRASEERHEARVAKLLGKAVPPTPTDEGVKA